MYIGFKAVGIVVLIWGRYFLFGCFDLQELPLAEGPSTQCLRGVSAQKPMIKAYRSLKCRVLGPSGYDSKPSTEGLLQGLPASLGLVAVGLGWHCAL